MLEKIYNEMIDDIHNMTDKEIIDEMKSEDCILNIKQVYCTDCFNFRLCDEGLPYCPFENLCDITDCEDSRSVKDRHMYKRKEK